MSDAKTGALRDATEGASEARGTTSRVKRSAVERPSLKKPTIRVVAAKAGVAVSTVSRYLNDDSVSPRMKARLSRVIESLGYRPSRTARNLSLGLKGCIGVVVDSIQDPWFTQLLTGMEEELQSRDISLMLLSLELRDTYDPAIAFEWIEDRRVDGLDHREVSPAGQAAREGGRGRADADRRGCSGRNADRRRVVRADNIAAGRTLGAHLAELGHSGWRSPAARASRSSLAIDCKGCARSSGSAASRCARRTSAFVPATRPRKAPRSRRRSWGSRRVQPPLCSAATLWRSASFGRRSSGVSTFPGDLSVAAFDGIPEGARSWPGLTTMAQPMREMGRDACRRLFAAIGAAEERTSSCTR